MAYLHKRIAQDACPVEAVVAIVAGKWKARLLFELSHGPMTFGQLKRSLPGVSQQVLSTQLQGLVTDGIVSRTPVVPEPTTGSLYALTHEGRSLLPVLDVVAVWGLARLDRQGRRWAHPHGGQLTARLARKTGTEGTDREAI
jgi:DNA-binding HxlR family transcriptional regulator